MTMFRLRVALCAACAAVVIAADVLAQASPEGCWLGSLGSGAARRRAAFEIFRSPAGIWSGMSHIFTGTVQSQEMSDLEVDGTSLSFKIAGVEGEPSFQGEISGTTLRGVFRQRGQDVPVFLDRADEPDGSGLGLVGNWSGPLQQNGTPLMRLVLKIEPVACGQITVTMDSPDQGAVNMPVTDVKLRGDSLLLDLSYLNGRYAGALNATGGIDGTWTQNDVDMTLNLKRVEGAVPTRKRPQEPQRPFPYDEEEVTYVNPEDGVTLAGTLTIPPGEDRYPAVLLLTGSGAQDRDQSLVGHRPFLVLADHLTRLGIAVLRVDDRGVGGSTGSTLGSTLMDSAEDALAGVDFLKSHPKIDARRIGLVGHSEGGWVAPIVATRSTDVAFIVLLAGPGVSGEELLLEQSKKLNRAAGSSGEFAEAASSVGKRLYETLRREADDADATAQMLELAQASRQELLAASRSSVDSLLTNQWVDSFDRQTAVLTTVWFRHLLTFDPRPTLRRVDVPVLALFGALDLQVPPEQNQPALEEALRGNTRVTIRVLENLNHLFQTAETGRMEEYGVIEETFARIALSIVSDWILEQTR